MRTLTPEELREVINKHETWLTTGQGERADLSGVYLVGVNLRGADLVGADMSGAVLSGADLRGTNLRGTNLSGADMCGTNLSGTNLSGANLRGTDLSGARGNLQEVKAVQCDKWAVTYTSTHMFIGCQTHTIAEWLAFSDGEINDMNSAALTWWRVWKPILSSIIEASPAVPYKEKAEESVAEVSHV